MRRIQVGCIEEGRRRKTDKMDKRGKREEWKGSDEKGERGE